MTKISIPAPVNLALAMVIVGSSVVAGKIMIQEFPVFLASALRFGLAVVLMFPILKIREGGLPRISRRSWFMLALQSLCGSFMFTVLLLYGLKLTSPAQAGIVTSTTPAFMGIIGWIMLGQRPSARGAVGILLSVVGLMVVSVARDSIEGGSWFFVGNMLVMGAVIFESLFLLMRKTVPEPISPLAASFVISMFGLVWFLPMGAVEAATSTLPTTLEPWLTVAYYGAVVTVLAYLCWFAGITKIRPATAGVFTSIMPVSALVLSSMVLDERLGLPHYLGCACVMAGILMIARR